jgi:hypothetical protein
MKRLLLLLFPIAICAAEPDWPAVERHAVDQVAAGRIREGGA